MHSSSKGYFGRGPHAFFFIFKRKRPRLASITIEQQKEPVQLLFPATAEARKKKRFNDQSSPGSLGEVIM